jgi:hypothetical protein
VSGGNILEPNAIAPILAIIVILVTLRGQRLQAANAFRDIHRTSRARARLIEISFKREPNGQLSRSSDPNTDALHLDVTVDNHSPDAVSELILTAAWTNQDRGDTLTAAIAMVPVLKSNESRSFLTIPYTFRAKGSPTFVHASWTDALGIRWQSSRRAADLDPAAPLLELPHSLRVVSGVAGRGPLTVRWWHEVRNAFIPYDYWIPAIEPQDGLNPDRVTRVQRILLRQLGKNRHLDRIIEILLKSRSLD